MLEAVQLGPAVPVDVRAVRIDDLDGVTDGRGSLDHLIDSIIECGLFPKIKKGKFEYSRRCQDGEHCDQCNYLNITDGLMTLLAAYDRGDFFPRDVWVAVTQLGRQPFDRFAHDLDEPLQRGGGLPIGQQCLQRLARANGLGAARRVLNLVQRRSRVMRAHKSAALPGGRRPRYIC